jgi:hypothetical protein
MEKKRFKEIFPNLAKEIDSGKSLADILFEASSIKKREWAGYEPTITDYLRRCDTNEEARGIINYLEKRGEITLKEAAELRTRLEKEGLRSFGTKKSPGFYDKSKPRK